MAISRTLQATRGEKVSYQRSPHLIPSTISHHPHNHCFSFSEKTRSARFRERRGGRERKGNFLFLGFLRDMGCSGFNGFLVVLMLVLGVCRGSSSNAYISWDDLSLGGGSDELEVGKREKGRERVIVVAQDGSGDSRTVQGAIDLVPRGNYQRVKIFIKQGFYREKVLVPYYKPCISLIGEKRSRTMISWHSRASDPGPNGHMLGTFNSASVAIESDYFCASWITFENTAPSPPPGAVGMQAVALRVSGDKAVFANCRVLGSQDTLFDENGRHFFYRSYIQGSIDFIFGSGRSLYQECTLRSTATSYGAIAASQRNSATENSGFAFLNCRLNGTGSLYLGRAWGRYARVVYAFCNLDDIIIPEGWYDWGDPSRRGTVVFGEYKCKGRGANMKRRVAWAKSLTYDEAKPFLGRNYIDGNQWLVL
ncbi:hypothetical protein AMTRI_Chr10g227250 [Amborella trichopoda]